MGSSLSAGMGPGKSTGGQIPSAELGWSQPLPRQFPMGFGGTEEVPTVGKVRKGCSHPLLVDVACRDGSSNVPNPSA